MKVSKRIREGGASGKEQGASTKAVQTLNVALGSWHSLRQVLGAVETPDKAGMIVCQTEECRGFSEWGQEGADIEKGLPKLQLRIQAVMLWA